MVYNYPSTRNISLEKRKKFLKAIVYDFLKKNNALGLYSDCYNKYNGFTTDIIKKIEEREGKPILDYCIDKSVTNLINLGEELSEFFFSSRVSFPWYIFDSETRCKIQSLDQRWFSLVNKTKNLI